MPGEQLQLLFPQPDTTLDQLFVGITDKSFLQILRQWRDWPRCIVALSGPQSSGVTTILKSWSQEVGGQYARAESWSQLDADDLVGLSQTPIALDDVDLMSDPHKLLTILNLAHQNNSPTLIGGHGQPASWHEAPKDLVSRLSATTRLLLPELDEERFPQRLRSACLQRFIDLPDETLSYVMSRLEQSYHAIEWFATELNLVMGREKKPASIPVARAILQKFDDYENSYG